MVEFYEYVVGFKLTNKRFLNGTVFLFWGCLRIFLSLENIVWA